MQVPALSACDYAPAEALSHAPAGQCEYPWEFPSYGRFGCKSDCGAETNTTKIAVNIKANFLGHPTVSPRVLMSSVRWNLCLNDPERTARGEADLCWYVSLPYWCLGLACAPACACMHTLVCRAVMHRNKCLALSDCQ